jgi:hypothetical protein
MISRLGRQVLLALLVVALIGLPGARTTPMAAGAGSTLAAMGSALCDEQRNASPSKGYTHPKDMTASCVMGVGCVASNFVAPEPISLLPVDSTESASQWRIVGPLSGLVVPPEVGPPIRSI